MNISMLGIDHSQAAVELRELFAFTKKAAAAFMQDFVECEGVLGCIVLSTCNRTEIWISREEGCCLDIYSHVCLAKNINTETYREFFVTRTGMEAVEHLFHLTAGMKSKIMGEDQILTQVKDSLALSREYYCTDNVLEVLFRMAVTSAKKVKTQVHLVSADESVMHRAIHLLKESSIEVKNKKCLVIGNGEMGKLAASKLIEEGAAVTVTVREYRSGVVNIPAGARRINYSERLNEIDSYDIIVSATASPNMTLKYEHFENIVFEKEKIFVDLAVPRDIEPEIADLHNVRLYNIDSFHADMVSEKTKIQLEEIRSIINEEIDEFVKWYGCRDIIPVIMEVSKHAANDVMLRLNKNIKCLDVEDIEKKNLDECIKTAAGKVVNKLMFSIRDNVEEETFRECIQALQKLY